MHIVSNTWCNFSAFRAEFLKALNSLGPSSSRGYYINSCYAHCQTGTQETWLRDDSPVLSGTVSNPLKNYYKITHLVVYYTQASLHRSSPNLTVEIYWICCYCCLRIQNSVILLYRQPLTLPKNCVLTENRESSWRLVL